MAKKKGSNRYYDEEFKQDVLRLADEGRPIIEVAESLLLDFISSWRINPIFRISFVSV